MSPARFRVDWTKNAVYDLKDIIAWVVQDSPSNARSLLKRIKDRAYSLSEIPTRGRVIPELACFGIKTFREAVIRPYRLFYRVSDDHVLVLAVLDGRRNLEDILVERLLRV